MRWPARLAAGCLSVDRCGTLRRRGGVSLRATKRDAATRGRRTTGLRPQAQEPVYIDFGFVQYVRCQGHAQV